MSMGAGQGLSFMLADVSPRDPAVLAAVTALIFVAVVTASLMPAMRASRTDPVSVLRGD